LGFSGNWLGVFLIRNPSSVSLAAPESGEMGIYGILFAFLVATIVLLLASIFLGFERGAKIAGAVLEGFGWLPIVLAGITLNAIWFFGIGCLIFNWCPLAK
jgi:hypothetical protein